MKWHAVMIRPDRPQSKNKKPRLEGEAEAAIEGSTLRR
jgi:hypothetical protein